MDKERSFFFSNSELHDLYQLIDHFGLNNRIMAFILGVSRQYISQAFAKQELSEHVYNRFILLIGFLQKLREKNPSIVLRKLAYETTQVYKERRTKQLNAIKTAFSKYVESK